MSRIYLDHNATTALRVEARAAMLAAMDLAGNPSSVHAEGRAARGVIERARAQVAQALGAEGAEVIFTSGATESAALAMAGRGLLCGAVEHEAVLAWADGGLAVSGAGLVAVSEPGGAALQLANSETGVVQVVPSGLAVSDLTQGFGKLPLAFNWLGVAMGLVSAHKLGGPKGVGAVVVRRGIDVPALIRGGGQEEGRRAGTENVVGIAGFGAAAEAAARDLAAGRWDRVAALRDEMEAALVALVPEALVVGQGAARLPNTTCVMVPGWKGETQVMQMDLAGFAISAGSACSSGKVRASRVLRAMGFDEMAAASAVRVSLGPETTMDEAMRFAESWAAQWRRQKMRAA